MITATLDGQPVTLRRMQWSPLTGEQRKRLKAARAKYPTFRAQRKACFYNATVYAWADGLVYCEGVAGAPGSPIVHHAWLLIDGVVFDPTWSLSDKDLSAVEYHGVELPGVPVRNFRAESIDAALVVYR